MVLGSDTNSGEPAGGGGGEYMIKIDYSNKDLTTTRDNVTDEIFARVMALIEVMNIDLDKNGQDVITTDELGVAFASVLYDVGLDQIKEEGDG